MLEATGYNYQHADQASAAGGSGPSGSVSGAPAETTPADAPYGPNGSLVTPPAKYHLITPFLRMIPVFGMAAGVAMTWPSGNSGMMNVTAAQWRNFATGLTVFESALAPVKASVGVQSIPEGASIATALSDLGDGTATLAGIADGLATAISDFAAGVLETQDAIRDLLDRISLDGLWDTVTGLLSGDGDRVLREIADDVSTVLENFQNQVKGVLGLLSELKTLLGEASDAFEKWLRPILVETFGEEHGNFLADAIDLYTDVQVGGAAAVIGLVSGTVALADPDTWKGLADTAIMIAKDPTKIDDVLKQAGSEFIALDEWQGDNPGRGFGEAAGNIASLFIPGGALAKGGSVAKGLAFTRNLFEKGELGRLGRLPGLGGHRTPDMPELPDAPRTPNIPEFTPTPDVPGSTLPPHGPSSSTPSSPTSPGPGSGGGTAPTGPSPNGSGSSHSGGGAGPGGSSSNGPAPTGGSPSTDGSRGGLSSNGPVPTGGSPSPDGGDGPSKPSGGAPVSPSMSPPGDSADSGVPSQSSSGPSPAGAGDGRGSGSSDGGGSNSGGGSSGSGDGPGSPSPGDRASSPTGGSFSPDSSPSRTSGDGSLSEPDLKHGNPAQEAPTGHLPIDGGQSKDDGGNSGTSDSPGVSGAAPDASVSGGDGGGHSNPLHSGEQSGDGWHRLDNDEVDPNYGRHPLDEHWTYGDYPDAIAPEVRGLISDPDAPWGRDGEGNPLSQDQYESVYNKSGPNGDHWQNWPPNAGAVPETRLVYDRMDAFVRDFGTVDGGLGVDRIGKFEGDYLAVMPDGVPATFEQRSLPIYSLTQPYFQFEMGGELPRGWTIEVSEVAPAFGRYGGGIQVRIIMNNGKAAIIPQLEALGLLQ
ncbi:TNT domain-containing protein [Mycobacterium sp. MBM]|nr:TNT domain-containing protein [Mycobacterium sp. MBM]